MPTFKSYLTGFILSIFFSILAFSLVLEKLLAGTALVAALVALALAQAWVQLAFFLHLGRKDNNARWNQAVFASTFAVIIIVVVGSLWIMNHLNYNMTPDQLNNQALKMEGITK